MPTTSHDARLTYHDFVRLPDDGRRHEIIGGVHYVTPSPNQRHQELVLRLCLALGNHLEDRPDLGRVFVAPFDVVFSFHDVVEPDVIFVAPDQLEILTARNIQGTPALVVEVLSPSTRKRDLGIKRRLYDRSGVREVLAGGFRRGERDDLETPPRWLVSRAVTVDGCRGSHAQDAVAARVVPGTLATVPLITPVP